MVKKEAELEYGHDYMLEKARITTEVSLVKEMKFDGSKKKHLECILHLLESDFLAIGNSYGPAKNSLVTLNEVSH